MSRTPLVSVDNSAGRDSRTQVWTSPELIIPKVFHVVSLDRSNQALSELVKTTERWVEMHPTWHVKLWHEKNCEVTFHVWVSGASHNGIVSHPE